jgi:hypothetical protein
MSNDHENLIKKGQFKNNIHSSANFHAELLNIVIHLLNAR